MNPKTLLTLLGTLAATTLAGPMMAHEAMDADIMTPQTGGSIHVTNACPFTLYSWAVASSVSNITTLGSGSTWSATQNYDPQTGNAIKIATTPTALWTGAPVFHISYTLNPSEGSIYYDLSSAFGTDPKFAGKKFLLKGDEGKNVPSIEWYGGGPSGTKAFFGETSLWLTLCA